MEDEYAIGLDLGTTFSCIGVYRNGWVEIIPNRNGEKITPSVVIISNDEKILVGEETTDFLVQNYDSCIYEVKRLIGKEIDDKELDKIQKRLPFTIVRPHGKGNLPEIKIKNNGKTMTYTPVEISSYIIKKMVFNAEKYLNKKISKLVITVPANFTDSQRALTRQAAEALKLKVLRIINEPTAAALAYGFDEKKNLNSNILIFDLGGGTFDVSILSLKKDEKDNSTSFEVLGTAGDTNLGGEDFDNALVEIVLRKIENKADAERIRADKKALKKLKVACENTKKILSISEKANICINDVMKDLDIIEIIYRNEFESECQPLFNKLIPPIEKAMQMAYEKKGKAEEMKIDEVILVGGSTRIPKVKDIVKNYFPNSRINDTINPDEAIAYGATIAAEKMLHNKDDTIKNFSLLDITPISLGTDVQNNDPNPEIQKEGNRMNVIIKRGTHIPVSNYKTYSTVVDNQDSMSINIYEGEKKYVKYNHLLKKSTINGLTKRPKGKTKVVIKFDIDVNGILNVEAKEESTDGNGQVLNLMIKNDEISLTNEEMEELKKKMETLLEKFGEKSKENKNDYINIKGILKKYKDAFDKCNQAMKNKKKKNDDEEDEDEEEDERIIYIKNYYTTLEEFINKFDKNFDNETVLYKFYLYIKDLFERYLDALKLDLDKGDKKHIFGKINEYIQIFIDKSSGYLNELLEVLSGLKKVKNKVKFYQIIVFVIGKLNELGKNCIISDKPFCKYHSLMYFELSHSYFEKYFPKKSDTEPPSGTTTTNEEEDRENMAILGDNELDTLKKESKSCLEYINDIKSGAILLCEEFLKKNTLIKNEIIQSSDRGITSQVKQHNIANLDRMNRDNRKIFLANYEKLLSQIQITDDFTKKEAICIANIIKICYSISEDFASKTRYLLYLAKRCETIVEHLQLDKNEDWYKEFNELYTKLKVFEPKEQVYQELLTEMKDKYPDVFKNLDDNFRKLAPQKFIKYILETHPYKYYEKDKDRDFGTVNPDLLLFLLKKYLPDNYNYTANKEESKLKHCIVQEISKKLNSLYTNIN